jgi:nicotinate-nucleotide adenylyltransferase
LGVFGGTFDPPHLGHLILAETARDQFQLDQVLWVVAGQSPLKLAQDISPVAIRVQMVQAAIADQPAFALSRVDLDRPGPHYTVDTLRLLRRDYPTAEFYFLLGADSLRDLPRWKDPRDLIELAWLVVWDRPDVALNLPEIEPAIPGLSARLRWLNAPRIEVAASDIRQRLRDGRSARYLLPLAVAEIIRAAGLYVGAYSGAEYK